MLIFGIFILAGLGALLRYFIVHFVHFEYGVFIANLLGSAAIGYVFTHPQWLTGLSPLAVKLVAFGFLGALTTYSSFSLDVATALNEGLLVKAGAILLAHNVLCISACLVTYKIAS